MAPYCTQDFFSELFKQLVGQDATFVNVVASFVMFMFGALFIFVIEVSFRNPKSKRTPEEFTASFLWNDNKLRFLRTLLLGMLFLMTGSTIVGIAGITVPEEWGRLLPLFAGISADAIALSMKRKFLKDEKAAANEQQAANDVT